MGKDKPRSSFAVTNEEARNFCIRISPLLDGSALNDWERQFLTSINAKLTRYGGRARLSEKQYAALQRILRKHEASDPIAPVKESASPAPRPTYTPKNRPKPGRSHRPVRVRSSNRKAKWIAFLVIGGFGALLGALGDDTSRSTFSDADRREAVSEPLKKVGQVDELGVSVSPRPKPMPPRKQTQPKAPSKSPHSVAPRSIRVVDGDTIRLGSRDQRIRLVGFNTPETWKPRCSRGEALGKQATARLSQLVRNEN